MKLLKKISIIDSPLKEELEVLLVHDSLVVFFITSFDSIGMFEDVFSSVCFSGLSLMSDEDFLDDTHPVVVRVELGFAPHETLSFLES